MQVQADKVEERWTRTTVDATFDIPANDLRRRDRSISIAFPLLKFGWTFALTLALTGKSTKVSNSKRPRPWTPVALSFHQYNTDIPWADASIHAQLSLVTERHVCNGDPPLHVYLDVNGLQGLASHNGMVCDFLASIDVVLAGTPSAKHPLATSYTFSSIDPPKAHLTVTVRKCPFPRGLFQASNSTSETEAQTKHVRQSGDRVLSRSLATGKLFDVKFMSPSSRPTSGCPETLLPTYASLSVLEKHINVPDSQLREEWTSALAALNGHDDIASPHVWELSCPNSDAYDQLDSDYEEDLYPVGPDESESSSEYNSDLIAKGKQPENSIAESNSSLTLFELVKARDRDSDDCLLEEVIKDSRGPLHGPSTEVTPDCERSILIKFAAHRTWHAFLWYCYTGHVEFDWLKSQVDADIRTIHIQDGPPTCSPKSMYRLASLLGEKDLMAKALQAIGERVTAKNVLGETFSVFTSRYPEVKEVLLSALLRHCESPEVKKAFLKTMYKYNSMPHAEPVLSAFYDLLVA